MANARVSLALEGGLLDMPSSGRIGLFRPETDLDLSLFTSAELHVIHGFWPSVHFFQERGIPVSPTPEGSYAVSFVFLPRSKQLAKSLIARAMRMTKGGRVIVDGGKTDGVDSILRALKKRGGTISEVIAKAHGKIFAVSDIDLSDWESDEVVLPDGHVTKAGVFSADAVDRGSALLGDHICGLKGKVADLGAGWGYLSGVVLQSADVSECHLIEAEFDALEAAKANLDDQRAVFHWSDATTFDKVTGFDHIVCNPPFHTSRAADPALGRAFIMAASRLLAPKGIVWLVANRHLPYETTLKEWFSEVAEIGGDKGFKIIRASRPRRARS